MNLRKEKKKHFHQLCQLVNMQMFITGEEMENPHLIMSSIIFPMEICRVPRDSWAGRMYASRVKLNMLVTANSTSAISWGSS